MSVDLSRHPHAADHCPHCGVREETCPFYEYIACYEHRTLTDEEYCCHRCGFIGPKTVFVDPEPISVYREI